MKQKIYWRLGIIAATIILALVYMLPDLPIYGAMPQWWKENMPDRGLTLGLDLQGGLHLVYEVQGERAVEISTGREAESVENYLEDRKLEASVKTEGRRITVTPLANSPAADIQRALEDEFPNLEIGSEDGMVVAALSDSEAKRIMDNAVDQALETIRNRIDQFGVSEPDIHRQAENEIVVQLPGVSDPQRAIDLIGRTAQLEFKLVNDTSGLQNKLPPVIESGQEKAVREEFADQVPEDSSIYYLKREDATTGQVTKSPVLIRDKTLLSGELLTEARVAIDQRYNEPYVSLSFDSTGARIFEEVTGENVGKQLAIILDGTVYSAPVIRERIGGGQAQISGNFSLDEAKDLAIVLRAGALPAPMKMLQNVTVGPSLGRDSIEAGKRAGMIGAILVIIFMAIYYKVSGLIADLALVLNIILLLGAMAMLEATLTLPGIAGVILAIGMAVDSNVLMFERMREEVRAGKTPKSAVDSGYDKAFWTIFDSHVTTLITALVLFQFGTGPIKGFAITLSLGVIINLFTALVGTKTVFDIIHLKKEVSKLSI